MQVVINMLVDLGYWLDVYLHVNFVLFDSVLQFIINVCAERRMSEISKKCYSKRNGHLVLVLDVTAYLVIVSNISGTFGIKKERKLIG